MYAWAGCFQAVANGRRRPHLKSLSRSLSLRALATRIPLAHALLLHLREFGSAIGRGAEGRGLRGAAPPTTGSSGSISQLDRAMVNPFFHQPGGQAALHGCDRQSGCGMWATGSPDLQRTCTASHCSQQRKQVVSRNAGDSRPAPALVCTYLCSGRLAVRAVHGLSLRRHTSTPAVQTLTTATHTITITVSFVGENIFFFLALQPDKFSVTDLDGNAVQMHGDNRSCVTYCRR